MRVTEKDDQLILHTSWRNLFSPFLLGLFFIAIAGTMLWSAGRESILNCTRLEADQIQCQLHQILLGHMVEQLAINNPRQAVVQTSHSSKGGTSYRMALITALGTVPLTDFYSSDAHADELAAQFNQFRQDPTAKSVLLDQPASGFMVIMLLVFCVFSLITILSAHYDTIVFDRYRDTVTYRRVRFVGIRIREEQLGGLKTEVCQFRGSKGRRYYCVFLRLPGGAPDIKLDWNASRESTAQDLADRIQDFVKPGLHIKYANV